MAGETNVKAEPAQDPSLPPIRPIAPEVLALLERGRQISEVMAGVRHEIYRGVADLVARYPQFRKQIADVLEGEAQAILSKLHQEALKEREEARCRG